MILFCPQQFWFYTSVNIFFSNTVAKNVKTPQDLCLSIVAVNLLYLKLI